MLPPRASCVLVLAAAAALWGCAGKPALRHTPPFAAKPYEPFSRTATVDIAIREWKTFGARVDDDAPGTRAPFLGEDKPERQDGLWQRIGEYWFIGMPPGSLESRWTGKHNADGKEFPPAHDGDYAWSAAFICYVMREAGAGEHFPYAPNHATYINVAREMSLGQVSGYALTAAAPTDYAPRIGDLICMGRAGAAGITFADLPAEQFPAHCDLVTGIDAHPPALRVIGGNVDDAVTLKHIPIAADGKLATADGTLLDTRYPWFVVLRILYGKGDLK